MSTQPQRRITPAEYLQAERLGETRNEYHDGEIFAMAGASYSHNLIVANVIVELGVQLKGKSCTILPSDLRCWIESAQRYLYSDVTVVCGKPEFTDEQQDTLANPTLLIEVLSKKTENYDRGAKFEHYRTLSFFTEYVLLAQDRPYCEHSVRQPEGSWLLTEEHQLESTIRLKSIDCTLALGEVYAKLPFVGPRRV